MQLVKHLALLSFNGALLQRGLKPLTAYGLGGSYMGVMSVSYTAYIGGRCCICMAKGLNKYCPECGSKSLVYYGRLSNPKEQNLKKRVLVYACRICTQDFEKPLMFSIRRGSGPGAAQDPLLDSIELTITQYKPKTKTKPKTARR